MKSERGTNLPLSTPAREILLSLPSRPGAGNQPSPFVFPGRGRKDGTPAPLHWIDRSWQRVRKRAECPELTLHDLRATVSTMMERAGVRERVIDAILNHAPENPLRRRYVDAPPLEDLREALEDHGRRILKAAGVTSAAALVWPKMAAGARILEFA